MSVSRVRTRVLMLCALASAGTLLQTNPGCAQTTLQLAAGSVDFCTIFNCGAGSFFNLCDPFILLQDCPGFIP